MFNLFYYNTIIAMIQNGIEDLFEKIQGEIG